jgi:putative transposase
LTAFENGCWGQKYPAISQSWRRAWAEVVPFYAFPGDVRRILYTTDEVDKPFRRDLLSSSSTGDRVAKSRDQGCKPDHAALSVVPPLRRLCAAFRCRAVAIG